MSEQRLLTGTAAGLFSGVVLGVIWVAALNGLFDLGAGAIIMLLTAVVIGAVGASLATLIMAAAARREMLRLNEAEHQARHDPLTGLTNRAELFNQLELSLEDATKNDMALGVLFLDLDRFKTINDSLGHEVGDELLRIVADRLKSAVRSTDVVARLGGDEFVVLCRGLLLGDSVVASAKQILKAFKEPISLNGKAHVVSTSIGIAIAEPGDKREADSLVSDADAAMYRAKRAKSGFAVFDEAHRQMVADRLDIERALMHAIESGQIVVYYQPIVDTFSRQLYGFEALVRWHHPEKGMIPPGDFLAIAEEAGMMPQIGTLVLRESCAQMAVWNHAAPAARGIRVGVNLAEQQLTDESFPQLVAETLAWSGVSPEQLVLEITEDVIVEHLDGLAVLRELRDLGVSLSIDDFGTGQSSLSYVKQFDMVSTLKIDQTFVRDMENATADRAIIEAVVAMATALELRVVAEGVEFSSQLSELRDLGVSLVQGFLFGVPMPADQIDPLQMFSSDPQPMPLQNGESDQAQLSAPNVPADAFRRDALVPPMPGPAAMQAQRPAVTAAGPQATSPTGVRHVAPAPRGSQPDPHPLRQLQPQVDPDPHPQSQPDPHPLRQLQPQPDPHPLRQLQPQPDPDPQLQAQADPNRHPLPAGQLSPVVDQTQPFNPSFDGRQPTSIRRQPSLGQSPARTQERRAAAGENPVAPHPADGYRPLPNGPEPGRQGSESLPENPDVRPTNRRSDDQVDWSWPSTD